MKEYTTITTKSGETRYVFDVDLGYAAGKRKRTTIRTKTVKEGREKVAALRLKIGKISSKDSPTLITAFDMFVDQQEKEGRALQTLRHAKSAIKHYEYLYQKKIDKITVDDLEYISDEMLAKGMKKSSIKEVETKMKTFFNFCKRKEWIEKNPFEMKTKIIAEAHKMNYMTEEQFKEFIEYVDNEHLKLMLQTLFYTGLRVSECLGLQYSDIKNGELHLSHTRCRTATELSTKFKTPNSKRIVPLPRWLDLGTGTGLIFPYSESWYRHGFIKYRRIYSQISGIDLDCIRIHDFRHSYVAMLIFKGVDLYTIKDLAGHKSITTTMDVYGHLYEEKRKSVADLL